MKQLMLQTDIDDKVITTTKTKPEDVFGYTAIVLAVGKNNKTEGYLVKEIVTFDNEYSHCKIPTGLELFSPYYVFESKSIFEQLWEVQQFYDLFIFEDFIELQSYMKNNNIIWGR